MPTNTELMALSASLDYKGQGWAVNFTWTSTSGGSGHYGVVTDSGTNCTFADSYPGSVTCVQ